MKAKNKNPLYVVKGDHVEAASGIIDLVIKKFNLQPAIDLFLQMFKFLLDNVQSYSAFVIVKNLLDEFLRRIELFKRFAIV